MSLVEELQDLVLAEIRHQWELPDGKKIRHNVVFVCGQLNVRELARKIIVGSRLTGVAARENDPGVERATSMAVSAHEAYEAGFTAGSQKPTISFDNAWDAFNVSGKANLPITLKDEFKRGYSSAIGYRMDSY